jgi:hypothetical protein
MAGKVKITDKDHGYAALVKRLYGETKARVEVGILAGEGHADDEHGEGTTLIDVATWMEFGTTDANGNIHVPERSFVRGYIDDSEDKLRGDMVVLMQSVVKGERTKEQALEIIGLRAVGGMQERISAGIPPENAPSTIAQKHSSTPLIRYGQLRAGISSRVKIG